MCDVATKKEAKTLGLTDGGFQVGAACKAHQLKYCSNLSSSQMAVRLKPSSGDTSHIVVSCKPSLAMTEKATMFPITQWREGVSYLSFGNANACSVVQHRVGGR